MADIPKLDLKSKDIAADKQQKLKELFPEIFTEGDKIDYEKLRLTLGDSIDSNDERFGLHWAGKKQCFNIIQEPSIGTLKPCKEESVNWDDTQNLFIEGDNLEVLKQLQKSYYGKVKMIYIDPPYNTGKEFIYPDKYQENIDTYLAYTGQIDDEGYKFSTNAETEGRYHSNWLNMMYPRLFLARNLLKEDGLIFISIDDNEIDNLRKLCSEIFGENNFLAQIIWQKIHSTKNDAKYYSDSHEYILCFAKEISSCSIKLLPRTEKMNSRFKNPDNDPRGNWSSGDLVANEERSGGYFDIIGPTGKKFNVPRGKHWVYSEENLKRMVSEGRIWFGVNGDAFPRLKRYLSDVQQGRKVDTIWLSNEVGHNQESKREIKSLFNGIAYFDTPKPTRLLKRILTLSTNKDDIILDFFAGSCSTAHAIIDLNKENGGNLKYIMAQLPEPIETETEAHEAGYHNIADISKERIKRVIENIEHEKNELNTKLRIKQSSLQELQTLKAKTPELFKNGKSKDLTKLESSIKKLQTKISNINNTDLGFKVFKLDKSNFKIWDGSVGKDLKNQIQLAIDHIHPDSSKEDIFYEILLKAGFELTVPVKEITLGGKKVFSIEDNALLICLEKELTEDLIRAIAAKEPARVVCLDTGFRNNDQLKTNAVQIMKSHNVHDFRTV
jgi:adenine-specific DNA-methyltransferase